MQDLVAQAGQFIEVHRAWAGPILALLAFGESMAFIGLFIPATALMILAGGLIGAGQLDPVAVIIWSIVGASLGDAVSYWLGRRIGRRAFTRWPLNRDKTSIARGRLFFRKYGSASIFLGRFFGPVRAIVPIVAGMMEMDGRRFQLANVLSAVVWVPVMLAPGYLAAKSLVNLEEVTEAHWLGFVAIAAALTVAGTVGVLKIIGKRAKDRPRRRTTVPVRGEGA